MDELDKKLKESLQENMTVPQTVNEHIQSAYRKIERKDVEKMKGKNKIIKIIIEVIMLLFAGGNIVAYATNQPNVISWVIKKLNMTQYEEYSEKPGLVAETEDVIITLKNVAMDSNLFSIGYGVKFKKEVKEEFYLSQELKIESNNKEYEFSKEQYLEDKGIIYKVSDTEYEIYEFYNIDTEKFGEEVTVKASINEIDRAEDGPTMPLYKGSWNFEYTFNKKQNVLGNKIYAIKDADLILKEGRQGDFEKISLLEIETSEMCTVFRFDNSFYTDCNYTAEIKYENGEVVLEKDLESLNSGILVIQNLDFKKKIEITIFETHIEDEISATMKVDLSKI